MSGVDTVAIVWLDGFMKMVQVELHTADGMCVASQEHAERVVTAILGEREVEYSAFGILVDFTDMEWADLLISGFTALTSPDGDTLYAELP